MTSIMSAYLLLKFFQNLIETWLAVLDKSYYTNEINQKEGCQILKIKDEEFAETLSYTNDKYAYSQFTRWINFGISISFLLLGGFGYIESLASSLNSSQNEVITGLYFFAIVALLSSVSSLPFDYYFTFVLEEKHGFNKQNLKLFFIDKIKVVILSFVLGGLLLAGLLSIMQLGDNWWLWAWVVMSGFSILVSWIYPTFLAPIFNKFSPLEEGELKDSIFELARKINFKTSGISIMDASKRSSHGNAYFTGVFGEKKIVLFDTLIEKMRAREVVAVLAHELGHFKLNHVRWGLIRGVTMTGFLFYILSLCLPMQDFYTAFHFQGKSNYAALVVFSMWFGAIQFFISPISSWLSRRNEFAADAFAGKHIENHQDLSHALIK